MFILKNLVDINLNLNSLMLLLATLMHSAVLILITGDNLQNLKERFLKQDSRISK